MSYLEELRAEMMRVTPEVVTLLAQSIAQSSIEVLCERPCCENATDRTKGVGVVYEGEVWTYWGAFEIWNVDREIGYPISDAQRQRLQAAAMRTSESLHEI